MVQDFTMRIAASIYLNSAPLVQSFLDQASGHTFLGDTAPARCAQLLASGQCDVALIPVIEYQRIPGLRVVPGIAVASKERVKSVVLACRKPIEDVRTAVLDSSSRTSQVLVRMLFERRFRTLPIYSERTPDIAVDCANMFEGSDAALVIGDPAMRLESRAVELGLRIYDLAFEWKSMTGLPFVFAVWATTDEGCRKNPELVAQLQAAKHEGVARSGEIARRFAGNLGLPEKDLLSYLYENVNFDLDEENLAGLRKYFSLAVECGLLDSARELDFV
jgi:predicted solute-binding protein